MIYSLEDYEGVGRVKWEGTAKFTADGLLAAQETERAPSRTDAEEFLRELLADGPRLTKDVEAAAADKGIKKRTLDRARQNLKIKSHKVNGVYQMELPSESSSAKVGTPPNVGIPGIPGIPETDEEALRYATSARYANEIRAANVGIPDGSPFLERLTEMSTSELETMQDQLNGCKDGRRELVTQELTRRWAVKNGVNQTVDDEFEEVATYDTL